MSKMKTHRGAAKRFRTTGTGRLRRRQANLNHFLGKKSSARKRRLARDQDLDRRDEKRIKRMLGR